MRIGNSIVRNSDFLQKLADSPTPQHTQQLIQSASRSQLFALVELSFNLLNFRLPLSAQEKRRLLKFADTIRSLSRTRSESSARRLLSLDPAKPNRRGRGVTETLARLILSHLA
jgi:hypothetical protein